MENSNKRTNNINRQSTLGMSLCVSGLGLLLWSVFSQFVGTAREPMMLFFALPVLMGLGLLVSGFALMVAGAEPFEDDAGGVRNSDESE